MPKERNIRMKQLALINLRNATEEDFVGGTLRDAARAVVMDAKGNVALLHVSRDGYYKLPGGGVEEGEDMLLALRRECQEEIGCDVEVVGEIGSTLEYWKEQKEKQTSYCYFAKVAGEKGVPNFTANELKHGFEAVWLPYEEAVQKVRDSKPSNYVGEYIVPRDLGFLEAAKDFVYSGS